MNEQASELRYEMITHEEHDDPQDFQIRDQEIYDLIERDAIFTGLFDSTVLVIDSQNLGISFYSLWFPSLQIMCQRSETKGPPSSNSSWKHSISPICPRTETT